MLSVNNLESLNKEEQHKLLFKLKELKRILTKVKSKIRTKVTN